MDLQSKLKTSIPYTIPELYTSIAQLVSQQIKESEERMKCWIKEEIGKIAKENKVGDTSTPKDLDMISFNCLLVYLPGLEIFCSSLYVHILLTVG